MIRLVVLELCVLAAAVALSIGQAADTGRIVYETRCAICHGGDGKGGEYAPSILPGIAARGDPELTSVISSRIPSKGMPRFSFVVTEMAPLLGHLRSLAKGAVPAPKPIVVKTVSGESLQGTVISEGIADLQLRTADGRIRLLESSEEAVSALMVSEDPWLQSCAAYAIGALGLQSLEPDLDRWLGHSDALLRETARRAKERLAAGPEQAPRSRATESG